MRGVNRYSDGNGEYQLPSGYSSAWVNANGEYLLSNQGGFDPCGDWKQLERK